VVRLVGVEKVNTLPAFVKDCERIGVKSSGKDQNGFLVERAEAGVEVIAISVDQVQGQDRDIHFGHGCSKFFDPAASASQTVSGEDAGSVGMPEKVAVAFEKIFAEIDFDHAIIVRATPVFVESDFALTGWVDHATGNDKFPISGLFAGEDLVGGEDHVLETFDGIDGFDGASVLLQNVAEILPLAARFGAIHRMLAQHVRIFLIHYIEIIRWAHEHGGHRRNGSGGDEGEASICDGESAETAE